jgi:hypothetical protein
MISNNDILKKLRVALKLKNDDIQKILLLANFNVSLSELNAFFRNEDHPNYKECGDQILRNFLNGLVIHLRGPREERIKENMSNNDSLKHKSYLLVIATQISLYLKFILLLFRFDYLNLLLRLKNKIYINLKLIPLLTS